MSTTQIAVRIDDELLAELRKLAEEERRTLAQMVRLLVEDGLAAKRSAASPAPAERQAKRKAR